MAPKRLAECPHCGATFPARRPACPECGSDHATGWRDAEDIDYLSVDLPDTYDESPTAAGGRRSMQVALVLVLVAAFVLAFVLRG